MSECASFREQMLEAEPAELRGEGESPLARHVRDCPTCARAAALLLEETARLDAFLADAPPLDVEAVLARAGVATRGIATRGVAQQALPLRLGARRLQPRRWWAPLAAAAALAGLLLFRAPDLTRTPSPGAAARELPELPLVEASADQDVAVMPTGNPDITVVWIFTKG